jgi:hypothetical protein
MRRITRRIAIKTFRTIFFKRLVGTHTCHRKSCSVSRMESLGDTRGIRETQDPTCEVGPWGTQ